MITEFVKQLKIFSATRLVANRNVRFEYGFGYYPLYHPWVAALRINDRERARVFVADFYVAMNIFVSQHLAGWERWPVQSWGSDPISLAEEINSRCEPSGQFTSFSLDPAAAAEYRVTKLYDLASSWAKGINLASAWRSGPIAGHRVGAKTLIIGGQHRASLRLSEEKMFVPVAIRTRRDLAPSRLDPNTLPLVEEGFMSRDEARRILKRIEEGFQFEDALRFGFPDPGKY